MKTTIRFKLLLGSVSALFGAALFASAAPVTKAANYELTVDLTNATLTPSIIVSVDGVPRPASTDIVPGNFGVVMTDGSGKIDGVWDLNVTNLTDMTPFTQGMFIGDVSGSVHSAGKTPVPSVNMSVKANGYVQDDTGANLSPANMNFSFKGNLTTLSASVPTPLGTNFTLITTNANGFVTTNLNQGPFNVETNTLLIFTNSPTVNMLAFIINQSINASTNPGATNIVQQENAAFIDEGDLSPLGNYNFGSPVASNVLGTQTIIYTNGTGTNAVVITNTFNWYAIGTNVEFEVENGFTNANFTNAVSGLADTNVAAFITAYNAAQSISNATEIQIVISALTNVQTAGTGTFSSTNITTPNQFTNTWFEVDGTLKGSINAGKTHHSLNNEAAKLFAGSHSLFSQGTDSNGIVIFRQVVAGNNAAFNNVDYIDSKVVTVNNSLWMSANMYDTANFSGKGSLNSHKSTYTAALRGVAFSRGSSAKLTGSTGVIVTSSGTNVVTLTNIAAIPTVSIVTTNNTGHVIIPFLQNNVTNFLNTTNRIDAHNTWDVPVTGTTNTIPNGITTVSATGKIQGQQFGPITGINPDTAP